MNGLIGNQSILVANMENLLESNERTLVIFDSVCSGLAECLALVHADIKQMTEHRNKLSQLIDQQKSPEPSPEHQQDNNKIENDTMGLLKPDHGDSMRRKSARSIDETSSKSLDNGNKDDDPHHLSRLKLLDKRLADSFNQALNMCDQQKSSLDAKSIDFYNQTKANNNNNNKQSKPSILQVLLGKSSSSSTLTYNNRNKPKQTVVESRQKSDNNHHGGQQKAIDNRLDIDDINRQTRLAMQYSRQLEANLIKVEDLRMRYEMHLKMGSYHQHNYNLQGHHHHHHLNDPLSNNSLRKSASRTSLTKSLSHSSLKRIKSKSQLLLTSVPHNSKTSIKEFIDNLDKLESEFESYTGTFLLTIEDIQGFARVCPGDVFEVRIKYGDSQSFKTKISVLKDMRQKCDNRQVVFKVRITDALSIKAFECKGLGKKVPLGHKLCETRDFFTARSQLMTISLNQTGSIKLNMIITWNPLHMAPSSSLAVPGLDISHISLPPTPVSSSTLSSLSSALSLNGLNHHGAHSAHSSASATPTTTTTTTINIQSSNKNSHSNNNNNHLNQHVSNQRMRSLSSHSPHQKLANGGHQHDNHQRDCANAYYDVDPTFGYYIPEPDYVTSNVHNKY